MKNLQKLHLRDAKAMTNNQMKHVRGGSGGRNVYMCWCNKPSSGSYGDGQPSMYSDYTNEEAVRIHSQYCDSQDNPTCDCVTCGSGDY